MKNKHGVAAGVILLCLSLIIPFSAKADFEPGVYMMLKPGVISIDDSDDEGFNLGFVFGHHFPKGFGIEADISRTIEDGDTDNNEYTVDLFSGFVTYRTPRKTHWKIKVGYSANDINLTGENNNVDGEGLVFGMGVGGKKFELEWTRYWAQKTAIDFLTFSFKIAGD